MNSYLWITFSLYLLYTEREKVNKDAEQTWKKSRSPLTKFAKIQKGRVKCHYFFLHIALCVLFITRCICSLSWDPTRMCTFSQMRSEHTGQPIYLYLEKAFMTNAFHTTSSFEDCNTQQIAFICTLYLTEIAVQTEKNKTSYCNHFVFASYKPH